jgi:uncharacterized membrane protein YjgN (DUF898 family)
MPQQVRNSPSSSGAPAHAQEEQPEAYAFEFTGTGGEYFRIWIVNLLLSIATLGVYSAWAKVRKLQYFYRNTRLAGSIFDYHGKPKAILKGRLLAFGLVVAYKVAENLSLQMMLVAIAALVVVTPFMLARSFRFKLANSSYRGLRFRFQGTVKSAYQTLILLPVVLALVGFFLWTMVTSFSRQPSAGLIIAATLVPLIALGVSVPLSHYLLKRFQHDNAYFGQTPFFFHAQKRDFFKIYARAAGLFFLGGIPAGLFAFMTHRLYQMLAATPLGWLFTLLYGIVSAYSVYLFVRPFLESRIQNLVWNATDMGGHRFESQVSARKLFWIHASNLVFITLTLGLYKPFATIRLLKYRIESMTLVPDGDLESFLSDQTAPDEGALGQEAGDLFDIDIAL